MWDLVPVKALACARRYASALGSMYGVHRINGHQLSTFEDAFCKLTAFTVMAVLCTMTQYEYYASLEIGVDGRKVHTA